MNLITQDNIDNYSPSVKDSNLEDVNLLVFGDWKDESILIDRYPEYKYTKDVLFNGTKYTRKWIIVPKDKVHKILKELSPFFTEDASIEIWDFDSKTMKTISEFIERGTVFKDSGLIPSKVVVINDKYIDRLQIMQSW